MDQSNQDQPLAGKTVAMLVANGFAEVEMCEPQRALTKAGATVRIVSSETGLTNGWHDGSWGHNFFVDVKVGEALPSQFDALIIPGGERSMAALLKNAHSRRIVKGMLDAGKPVGALSLAPTLLIAAEAIQGRTVTGDPSLQEAVEAAGGIWGGGHAITDGRLVSSAGGEDLPAFIETFKALLEEVESEALVAA
ncbi:MAG: peptidase C56 [Alphaproteobacteria bacterium]|nr:peptidase C56 [Alphaproteobacteria bacterium]